VLTVSWDHTARLWDAWSGVPISEPMKHNAWVNAATFAFDGATVLTATGGEKPGEARLWYSPRPIPERLFNLIADTHVRGRYSERNVDEYLRYLSAWEKLATEGAEWLAERRKFDERRTIGWHHYEAAEAEDRGDWFAAEFHLRWLLKSAPDDADLKKRHERVARELAAVRRSSAETTQKAQNKTERAEDKR
jgi:hypothetical protein